MNLKLHIPEGTKDFLIKDNYIKKNVESRLEIIFKRYGFFGISTPTFEHIEVFQEKEKTNKTFKFLDRDGSLLVLRSDMTPPIARIVATNNSNTEFPLRYFYTENSFRYNENLQGKLREFTQSGVELIGINSYDADAEIIALSINSLLGLGLTNFKISIGQVDFLNGIFEESNFSEEQCKYIERQILITDFVSLKSFIEKQNINSNLKEIFLNLQFLSGSVDLLDRAYSLVNNEKSKKALDNLKNIYEIIKDYNLENYISFDLSKIGYYNYYTGIIFNAYAFGTGFSILDGGRYDNLIKNFGKDLPSIGFAIKINNLIDTLKNENINFDFPYTETLVMYSKEGRKQALVISDELRQKGLNIENSLLGDNIEKNISYAKHKNIDGILFFTDDKSVKTINIKTGEEDFLSIKEFLK